jgi:VIT1/CCC1 family predicted Fe2+/Mn2+ transporter
MRGNPAGAIYGLIAVGALLAAESDKHESYGSTVAAVLVTLTLYWLAHAYAEVAGERLQTGSRLTFTRLATTMLHEVSLLAGAAVPLIPIVFLWAVSEPLHTAVTAAIWTSAVMILLTEILAAVRSELHGREFIEQVCVGTVLGLLVVGLKLLLH